MIKKTLTSNRVDQVDNVIHIADVHIRNFKRHDEYESVFQRVYDYCKEEVGQNKNTIIYLAGDIVHAKTDMSPELIVQTRNFFVNLAQIAPVILIAGNHDMNLNNRNRLDALTPIVDSIDTPDFFYLKETGVYTLGGVHFILNAVWEDPDNFITAEDVVEDGIKVVLYHGAVDKSTTDTGVQMHNSKVTIEKFKGYDAGMFGDIHLFQYLDGDGKFAYAGSLIQQNFGEGLTHGIIHWFLKAGTNKFVPILNDWAYLTIDIRDGKIVNLPTEFSKNNRIRVRSYNTSNSDLFTLMTKLKSLVNVDDVQVQKFNTKSITTQTNNQITRGDVRDTEYQNELITNYLERNYGLDSQLLDEIRKLNRNLNTSLNKNPVLRNVTWYPIKFEFSNMFSYGEKNEVDFSQMNGTYGIFAPNASGKSSILDALTFCIYDTCSRTFKASQILNNKKDEFRCKLHFQINNVDYYIERVGIKDKKGHVKVNVNFWFEEDGERVSLNGEDRDGTNFIIRNYLGTYEDFIITTLSLQTDNTNFIDMAQRERKDLLAQFLDLNLFEELNGLASAEIKSVQTLIKEYSRQDYSTLIVDANDEHKRLIRRLEELNSEKDSLQEKLDSQTTDILHLNRLLKPIDDRLVMRSLDDLIEIKGDLVRRFSANEWELTELQKELGGETGLLELEQEKLNKIDYETLLVEKEKLEKLNAKHTELTNSLVKIKLEMTHNQNKIDNLSTHEYDPNCQYCINNIFVQDAKTAEARIITLQQEVIELESNLTGINSQITSMPDINADLRLYLELEKNIVRLQRNVNDVERRVMSNKSLGIELSGKVEKIEELIQQFILNEGIIQENKLTQAKIDELESQKIEFTRQLKQIDKELIDLSGLVRVHEKTIEDCVQSIKKLKELETQFEAYNYYLKAVNRNGVPYELISLTIPKIQGEVNSILSQIVDFEVLFETDGKSINTYIVYDDENFWPLELTSGMEKFISSLAIRVGLINVSSLPRPNFIAIDEGWGSLDSENLNSLHMFFEYMKTQFEFMLTISHIDALRDIMDSLIEIKKESGFSKINF